MIFVFFCTSFSALYYRSISNRHSHLASWKCVKHTLIDLLRKGKASTSPWIVSIQFAWNNTKNNNSIHRIRKSARMCSTHWVYLFKIQSTIWDTHIFSISYAILQHFEAIFLVFSSLQDIFSIQNTFNHGIHLAVVVPNPP